MPERTLEELICLDDPGWPEVQQWIAEAKNHVDVLPASDPGRKRSTRCHSSSYRPIVKTA